MTAGGIVIVGAGQAAAVAAHALREGGYDGRIVMVGREQHRPYERPPSSKAMLAGTEEPGLQVLADDAWIRCKVELRSGCEVQRIDTAQRQLHLAGGEVIECDKCLLAMGGEAGALACLSPGGGHVHYLRTLDDARRLREALRRRPHLAVLGGGFLGLEIAHSAVAVGASVTVLEFSASLLARFLPPEASAWVEATLRSDGAQLLLGICVERAAGLAIAPGGGVLVDAGCRSSDEHVFAGGNCASQQSAGQLQPSNMESWQNANEQARAAAAAMPGGPAPVRPYPWFRTDQGRPDIQMLGLPGADLTYVRRGDLAPKQVGVDRPQRRRAGAWRGHQCGCGPSRTATLVRTWRSGSAARVHRGHPEPARMGQAVAGQCSGPLQSF